MKQKQQLKLCLAHRNTKHKFFATLNHIVSIENLKQIFYFINKN